MSESKKYRLETISDIIDAVTPENIDNFLIDLKSFIKTTQNLIYLCRIIDPDLAYKKNSEIGQPIFNWIDDGKHEATGGLTVEIEGEKINLEMDIDRMNAIAEVLKKK